MKRLNLLIVVLGVALALTKSTRATGLGKMRLLSEDMGDGQGELSVKDSLFQGLSPETEEEKGLQDALEHILKSKRIDLVAPGKQLVDTMNTISSKTRAMFLDQYDQFFGQLNINSTSRPMLYSYLGLQYATRDQLIDWFNRTFTNTKRRQFVDACKSLIKKRKSLISFSVEELEIIHKSKAVIKNKFALARMVFENNLNLFMLDNFVILCSKIELDKLKSDLQDTELTL